MAVTKLLTIYQPEKIHINGKVRLQSRFDDSGSENILWYESSETFGTYMTTERVDAFLVGLLWLALKKGQNILVKGALSEKLYYSLNHHLIPLIAQIYKHKHI
jgi:hypothetical protein